MTRASAESSDPRSESSGGRGASRRVAVVGAGLAGLRAATELTRRGLDVRVFEARTRVGGRSRGEWADGHWMDRAWPVLGGRDEALVAWARELDPGELVAPLRPVQTVLLRHAEQRPVDGLTIHGAARIPGPTLRERVRLLRWGRLMARHAPLLDPDRPERAASLDFRSVRDHAALYFGPGNLEFWLGPELQAIWGDDVDSLSRVALLLHARSAGLGERRPPPPGLPRRPLFELAQTAAEGLDLRLGTAVQRIDERPAGGFALESLDASGTRQEEVFDAVVLTVDAEQTRRVVGPLLTPAERDFFAAVADRPVVTLSASLEGVHAGLPQEIRVPRREGSAIAAIVIEPGQAGGRAPEGRSQLVLRARDGFAEAWRALPGDVVTKNLLSSLELTLPGLADRIVATRLGRGRRTHFEVGHFRRLERFRRVQLDRRGLGRRLYWAGEAFAGPTFEAAIRSGRRAADAVVEDLARD